MWPQLVVLVSLALPASAERLPAQRFTTADGLAHSRIARIVQDTNGFVWFCTAGGLTRFDGQSFVSYGVDEGLSYPVVNDLVQIEDGYWVATNGGGVFHFATGDFVSRLFTPHPVGRDVTTNRVNVLFRDSGGTLWAGTDGGLFRLSRTTEKVEFVQVPLDVPGVPDRLMQIWALTQDATGNLWIGTRHGLVRRSAEGIVSHLRIDRTATTDHVRALLRDSRGFVWIGHQSGLLLYRPSTTFDAPNISLKVVGSPLAGKNLPTLNVEEARWFTASEGLGGVRVTALTHGRNGSVWIGLAEGVFTQFKDGALRAYNRSSGAVEGTVQALTLDRGGNLWVGTVQGAARIASDGFVTFAAEDDDRLTGAITEFGGAVHVAGSTGTVGRFTGESFTTAQLPLPGGVPPTVVRAALVSRTGEWWLSTTRGVYRFGRVHQIEELAVTRAAPVLTSPEGDLDTDVDRLYEDRRGDIWMTRFTPGDHVLTRWERRNGRLQHYSSGHGLPPFNPPRAFAEDSAGNLWLGFRGGELVRYTNGRFETIVPARPGFERAVAALHVDAAGQLWAAMSSGGLMRIDVPSAPAPTVRLYTIADGFSSNIMRSVTTDGHRRVYVGTSQGIDRFDPDTGRVTHYGARNGVHNTDFHSSYRDRLGGVWFTSLDGPLRIVPTAAAPSLPPSVRIGELHVAGEPIALSASGVESYGPLHLPLARNNLRIGFFGLTPDTSGGVRFQYRLHGADAAWTSSSDLRAVTYANLSSGSYRFEVRAVAVDGTASDGSAVISFTIVPPWWRRAWFFALAAVALMGLAYSAHRYRVSRLVAIERVRTRIASDLHDDIGAGLSQMAVLTEVAQRHGTAGMGITEPLAAIAQLSRDLVDSMSDIVWAINPRRDNAADLSHRIRRFASDLLGSSDIRVTFEATRLETGTELGADVRREVWLIFKEAITNVVRHSGASETNIVLGVERRLLSLRVSDDGRGFDPVTSNDGNGLANMRNRAQRLGGRLVIDSSPAGGTVVHLTLPLRPRGRPYKSM